MLVKEALVFSFLTAGHFTEEKRIFFLTPAGIISGELPLKSSDGTDSSLLSPDTQKELDNVYSSARNLVEQSPAGEPYEPWTTQAISLNNVEIQTFDLKTTLKLPALTLFADQIVGASLTPPEIQR